MIDVDILYIKSIHKDDDSYLYFRVLDSHRSPSIRMLNNAYRREAHNLPQSCHIFVLLLPYLPS